MHGNLFGLIFKMKIFVDTEAIKTRGGKTGLTRRAGPFGPLFLAGWVEVLNSLSIVGSARLVSLKYGAGTGRGGPARLTRWKRDGHGEWQGGPLNSCFNLLFWVLFYVFGFILVVRYILRLILCFWIYLGCWVYLFWDLFYNLVVGFILWFVLCCAFALFCY